MVRDVGFRFHPTDRELCAYYLPHKNAGNDARVKAINEVIICAHEPEELHGLSNTNLEKDNACYFFSHSDPKYPKSRTTTIRRKGSRKSGTKVREAPIMNRSTKSGSWKPTGNDREIKVRGRVIGFKKTLVFYLRGKGKGTKTDWVMHEYRAASISPTGRNYVICKVKNKEGNDAPASPGETGLVAADSVDLASPSNIPEDKTEMLVPAEDSLNALGGSGVNIIDMPYGLDIDSMLPKKAMDDNWIQSFDFDSEVLQGLLADPDDHIIQNSVYRTNYSCYRQQQSIIGEYTDSSSDTDSETTEQQNFDEISSPTDSVCSSEGWNKYKVDIQKMDDFTEDSAVTKEYEYKAKEAVEPRKAIDQSKDSSTELSSTQMMQACAEESVITETLSKSQNKVTEAAEPRIMKLKSLMIHLLILVISIAGFKKLLYAKHIHNHNL